MRRGKLKDMKKVGLLLCRGKKTIINTVYKGGGKG